MSSFVCRSLRANKGFALASGALLVLLFSGCGGGGNSGSNGGSNATNTTQSRTYTLTGVAPLSGDVSASATAINNAGFLAATSYSGQPQMSAILARLVPAAPHVGRKPAIVNTYYSEAALSTGSSLTGLGMPLNTTASSAAGLNDENDVVGSAAQYGGVTSAIAIEWQAGQMIELPPLATNADGSQISAAFGINDVGTIVGTSASAAVTWQNGIVTALPSGQGGQANAINSAGVIAGIVDGMPVMWNNGLPTTLPLPSGATSGAAVALNDADTAAGHYYLPNAGDYACTWQNGKLTGLLGLSGGSGDALAINAAGTVVGQSNGHAVVWRNGKVTDLNSFLPSGSGWVLYSANGINDRGQITGFGSNGAFILTPVS